MPEQDPNRPINVRVNRHTGRPVKSVSHTISGARSMVRALPARAALGEMNEPDLAQLAALVDEVHGAMAQCIDAMRSTGSSWADIGRALGVTRQAAQQYHARIAR
jgi:hypothetical protein